MLSYLIKIHMLVVYKHILENPSMYYSMSLRESETSRAEDQQCCYFIK
jgi:hypothetical protein